MLRVFPFHIRNYYIIICSKTKNFNWNYIYLDVLYIATNTSFTMYRYYIRVLTDYHGSTQAH